MPRKFKTRLPRIVSPHGGWLLPSVAQSNGGTQQTGTDRFSFVLNADAADLQFLFVNGYGDSTGQVIANGNAVQMNLALELGSTLAFPSIGGPLAAAISTGGKTAKAVPDGALALSEKVSSGAYFKKGTTLNYRVHKKVSSGEKWPYNRDKAFQNSGFLTTTDVVYGSTVVDGSDQTAAYANQAWGASLTTSYAWGAVAILGRQVTPQPVVLITGDSIAAGSGSKLGRGYIGEACADANISYHNNGVSGCTLQNLTRFGQVPQFLAGYADHVVIHALTNDGNAGATFANMQSRLIDAMQAFGTHDNALWFSTILPRTDGSWSTYGGQTVTAWEAIRVQFNNWLRDPSGSGGMAYLRANAPPGVKIGGFVDACPAIERNSDGSALVIDGAGQQVGGGFWLASPVMTTDGTHPNATATALMKAYVPVSQFTF